MKYYKVKCGCGDNPINRLTYDGLGFPDFGDESIEILKMAIEKGKCKICGKKLRLEEVEK